MADPTARSLAKEAEDRLRPKYANDLVAPVNDVNKAEARKEVVRVIRDVPFTFLALLKQKGTQIKLSGIGPRMGFVPDERGGRIYVGAGAGGNEILRAVGDAIQFHMPKKALEKAVAFERANMQNREQAKPVQKAAHKDRALQHGL
jgi:hypothetical protein